MSAAPARNESRSPSLEYVPRSPSPDAPSFPLAITTEAGTPVTGHGTPETIPAPPPPLPPAYPLRVIEASQLAAAVAAETRIDSTLRPTHPPLSPQSVANILQGHTDIPT